MTLEPHTKSTVSWAAALCLCLGCESDPGSGPAKVVPASSADNVEPQIRVEAPVPVPNASPPQARLAPPSPLVEVELGVPGLQLDLRYATARNFTGAPVPGYRDRVLWLHEEAALALERARQAAVAEGFGLWVFDAYRPTRASAHFVNFALAQGHANWVREGYIAKRSAHGQGIAVDLSLYSLETGEPVDMGGEFDSFDKGAHTRSASGPARANRLRLRDIMRTAGFTPYAKEWWHFALPGTGAPQLDAPLG